MLKNMTRWLNPPVFEDEEQTRVARILNYLILIIIFFVSLLLVSRFLTSSLNATTLATLSILIAIFTGCWFLLRKGFVKAVSIAVVLAGWLALTQLARGEGVRDTSIVAYFITILIATVLLGWKASTLVTFASIFSLWYFSNLETSGRFTPNLSPANQNAIDITFIFIISAALLYLLDSGLRNTAKRAQAHEQKLLQSNQELQALQIELEQRVNERAAQHEESAAWAQRRASQLEAIAEVASSAATVRDLSKLLPYVTELISERFGFYHAGIFLLSQDKDYAILRAANSEGGKVMLERKHQLRVGQEGVVGFAIAQKRAHIALDVGEDAVFFNNPDLPATHSEMALPLMTGDEIIGVLDIQSEEPNAFSNEDIGVLTTLANQVAVAIENARLFQQSQETLKELDATFQRYISSEWRQFSTRSKVTGYRAHKTGLDPITKEQTKTPRKKDNRLANEIPVLLRGAPLGKLNINLGKPPEEYTEEENSLIETVADRLALALESARLLEESQRAAAKEQTIGEITGKIGASINIRNVLQTAVEELGRAIPESEIVIQFDDNQNGQQG